MDLSYFQFLHDHTLSNDFLKVTGEVADTVYSEREFQSLTTLSEKKF